MRVALAAAVLVAAIPVGFARAEHCPAPIYLFTSTQVPGTTMGAIVLTSTAIGCTLVGEVEGHEPDTDVIYPGGNYWQIRSIIAAKPSRGTLTFAGSTTNLTFEPGKTLGLLDGAPWWDTPWFTVDPASTVNGGNAVITICLGLGEDEECSTRTYRTVA